MNPMHHFDFSPIRRRYSTGAHTGWVVAATLIVAAAGCQKQPGSSESSDRRAGGQAKSGTLVQSREGNLTRIRRLIAMGGENEAERGIQAHLLQYPDDPDALVLAAQLFAASGKIEDAISMLDSAAELSGDQGQRLKARAGVLLAEVGRWQDAIERLEAFVEAQPGDDDARRRLAEILNLRGYRFDANEHIRRLCRRGGATADELRGLMAPSRAYRDFSDKPNAEDAVQLETLGPLSVARALLSEGDVGEANQAMENSRLVRENHPAAVAFYGQVLFDSQQFDAFDAWLGNVSTECQRYPAYWIALGSWAMRHRKHDSAVRMFAEAILREPGDIAANDRMTLALAAGGHLDASERFRQRGVEIDRLILRTVRFFEGRGTELESIREISEGLNRIGRPLESLAWYRIALQRMGSPPDAIRQLDEGMAQIADADIQAAVRRTILCDIDLDEFPLDVSLVIGGESSRRAPQHSDQRRPASRPPAFVDVASKLGLEFRYRNAKVPVEREFLIFQQTGGGGVACLDYDLDGRVDFYIGQAAADPPLGMGTRPNLLSRNLGDRFHPVTTSADCDDRGYTGGVTAGDWNQDGFPDLVVANMQRNTLLINQGDGTFRVQPGDRVWDESMYTASVAMGDIDGDHLPDIVEINYLDDSHIFDPIEYHPDGTPVRLPAPRHFQPAVDRVFVSRGDGSLQGRTLGDPARPLPATGLGAVVTDINDSPGNEVFVANDRMANHLWERQEKSEARPLWQNIAAARGVAYGNRGMPLGSMGIAADDFDENGRIDLHVTNFEDQWSNQYMQDEAGFFEDIAVAVGLGKPTYEMVGFGTQAIDYDNNSRVDLVIGNGHIEDMTARGSKFEMPTQIFALQGTRFVPMEVSGDDEYWDTGHLTRALAVCDWNQDGRVDFVTTDLKQPFRLLENRTETEYHWLQLQLVGTRCERDAIGATIRATFGPRTITKVVQTGDGFMCKNQSLICIGLGESDLVDRLEIRWPDGRQQTLLDIAADQRWLIIQDEEPFSLDPR